MFLWFSVVWLFGSRAKSRVWSLGFRVGASRGGQKSRIEGLRSMACGYRTSVYP